MKGLLPGRGDSVHLGGFHVEEPAVKHTGPGANRPALMTLTHSRTLGLSVCVCKMRLTPARLGVGNEG